MISSLIHMLKRSLFYVSIMVIQREHISGGPSSQFLRKLQGNVCVKKTNDNIEQNKACFPHDLSLEGRH